MTTENKTFTLTWRREPPDAEGPWLRWIGGKIDTHFVRPGLNPDDPTGASILVVLDWCCSRYIPVSHPSLQGWWWCGPIPDPMKPALDRSALDAYGAYKPILDELPEVTVRRLRDD